ncbi:hypothetical protein BJY04DRAFT_218350 [Aspergillus karnatakaensis]|uniref:uncharacterized protein n=1 Tax=Aspergillus karnatakaensis TaxID=1810916 RepID=UPI003CCD30C6
MLTTCPVCMSMGKGPSLARACIEDAHIVRCVYCSHTFSNVPVSQTTIFPETYLTCPSCKTVYDAGDPAIEADIQRHIEDVFPPGEDEEEIHYLLIVTNANGSETRYPYPQAPQSIRVGNAGWGVFVAPSGEVCFGYGIIERVEGTGGEPWIRDPLEGVLVEGSSEYVLRTLAAGREDDLEVVGQGYMPYPEYFDANYDSDEDGNMPDVEKVADPIVPAQDTEVEGGSGC